MWKCIHVAAGRMLRATRRAKARANAPELAGDPTEPPYTQRRDWLAKALVELPTEQRVTLELTDFGGYSCDEIARIMVCPVNTVKARMFCAREKLRVMLPQLASRIGTGR